MSTERVRYLDHAATGGLLWVALAAAVAARRRDPKPLITTARETWTASLVAHVLARMIGRQRPMLRRLARGSFRTSSPSFPSRHAATAFAGATSLGLQERRLFAPLLALAATVAASRVYRGLHYPSDAVAGAALGTALTAADNARTTR